MTHIAGILYPQKHPSTPFTHPFAETACEFYRYKNLEFAIFGDFLFANPQKTVQVALDGNIYNYLELKDLLSDHYTFVSERPEEVILAAYTHFGEDFPKHLNGNFTIALFDETQETLFLVRDRLGEKSLYFSHQGGHFLFSTEIKGLLATGIVAQTPSLSGLSSYLHFGFIPQDITPISNVIKLLPSHAIKLDLKGSVTITPYFSLSALMKKKVTLPKEEVFHTLGTLLDENIKHFAEEKIPVGLHLTPTNASLTLLHHLQKNYDPSALSLFFTTFAEPDFHFLHKVLESVSLTSHATLLTADAFLNDLVEIVWLLDEPVFDASLVHTWALKNLSQQSHISLLYSEMGSEELFASNARYFKKCNSSPWLHTLARLPEGVKKWLFKEGDFALKWNILRYTDIDKELICYLFDNALFPPALRKKIAPILFPFFAPEILTQRFHRMRIISDPREQLLYFDAKTRLPDLDLFQRERLMNPFGIKLLTPYLDLKIIELLSKMPFEMKYEASHPEAIFIHYLKKVGSPHLLPQAKEKASFPPAWRHHPRFAPLFDRLSRGLLVEEGLLSPKALPSLSFEQHFALLILEIWFRLYIYHPIQEELPKVSPEKFLE